MKMNRTLIIRIAAVAVLIATAALMMLIGRGHTVYFDNVTLEKDGQTYSAFYKVVVSVKDENVAKLFKRERGMTTNIGDTLKVDLAVTETKDGEEAWYSVNLKLPHNVDGIVVNLPALLAGQPMETWFSEFVPAVEAETEPEEIEDGLDMDMDMESFNME